MLTFHVIIVASLCALVQCQRGSFARPIGFPAVLNKTTTTVDPLGNRFGEGDSTTETLPLEANGDRDLVDRISKWPIDNQPFWYLNWKALEKERKNPQTYPQRPSQFAETPNFNAVDSRFGTPNSNTGTPNSNVGIQHSNSGTQSSSTATLNAATNSGTQNSNVPSLGNRHGGIETNSNTGDKRQVNTGFNTAGYGHYPHNRYGT